MRFPARELRRDKASSFDIGKRCIFRRRRCLVAFSGIIVGSTLAFLAFSWHWLCVYPSPLYPGNALGNSVPPTEIPHFNVYPSPVYPRNALGNSMPQREIPDFSTLYEKLNSGLNASLYYFDRPGRLIPMMRRMSESEKRMEYRIAVGRAWLRTQSVVVAATVRNAMSGLPNTIANLERLLPLFNSSWLVFVENESKDDTRAYLYNLTLLDPSVTLLGCDTVNSPNPCKLDIRYSSGKQHKPGYDDKRNFLDEVERGLVMSALRNLYLNYIYDNLADKASLLLMIDPDITWSDWDIDSIAQGAYYFKTRSKLNQLCAHTIDKEKRIYDPCTLTFFLNKHFGEDTKYPTVEYEKSLKNASADLPPVKVESCFQAFAFYRLSHLASVRLQYSRSPGEWICEHNTLSRQLQEVYIDPQMRLYVKDPNIG